MTISPRVLRETKASLQKEKGGVDTQQERQETRTPRKTVKQTLQAPYHDLPLLYGLAPEHLDRRPPLQLELAMVLSSSQWHVSQGPGEGLPSVIESKPWHLGGSVH